MSSFSMSFSGRKKVSRCAAKTSGVSGTWPAPSRNVLSPMPSITITDILSRGTSRRPGRTWIVNDDLFAVRRDGDNHIIFVNGIRRHDVRVGSLANFLCARFRVDELPSDQVAREKPCANRLRLVRRPFEKDKFGVV